MQQIIRTKKEDGLQEVTADISGIEDGAWIRLFNTSEPELKIIGETCGIPLDFLKAALDEEERPRIDMEDGVVLVVIDIPTVMENEGIRTLTTLPLGIIITEKNLVTVCKYETHILDDFISGKVRHFATFKKTRFLFQIFYRNASSYLTHLRQIEKSISHIESELHKSMKNEELFHMMEMQKSLIYFSTSLKSNEVVLERIMRVKPLRMYEEDSELLDDVIIENKQALEMSQIYLHIINGMTDTFATIISNNLNIVMKFLASVTIILAIPTMIASFYGMNVGDIPLSGRPFAFETIFIISFMISAAMGVLMWRKKIF
ncbi:magnesium transporter CorA family protein [Methanoregula sp.]|uniref:magnesium transporter CorA family protein n=1 Tax=Methanoregula sp. TaxID=2052170 RepID=UPI00356343A5